MRVWGAQQSCAHFHVVGFIEHARHFKRAPAAQVERNQPHVGREVRYPDVIQHHGVREKPPCQIEVMLPHIASSDGNLPDTAGSRLSAWTRKEPASEAAAVRLLAYQVHGCADQENAGSANQSTTGRISTPHSGGGNSRTRQRGGYRSVADM